MNQKRVKPDPTESVALMMLAEMSDLVEVMWILRALRKGYPDTRVAIVTAAPYRSLVEGEGAEFIECPPRGVLGIWRTASALHRSGYRQLADLQGSSRTALIRWAFCLRWLFRAKTSVAEKTRKSHQMLTRKFRKVLLPNTFNTERYRLALNKLSFVGLSLLDNRIDSSRSLATPPADFAEALGTKSGLWVGYAPFADERGRMFPTSTSDKLVALLAERFERVVIFGGGAMERQFAEGVAYKYGPKVVPAVGMLSPYDEMQLMRSLDLLISPDSPSLHLASLASVPVLSIWGATHPFAGGAGYGQNPEWQLQLDLPCRPCSLRGEKGCMFGDWRCINNITPEMVVSRAEEIIASLK